MQLHNVGGRAHPFPKCLISRTGTISIAGGLCYAMPSATCTVPLGMKVLNILSCPRKHSNGCWGVPTCTWVQHSFHTLSSLSAYVIAVLDPFRKYNDVRVVRIRHLSPQVSIILNRTMNSEN